MTCKTSFEFHHNFPKLAEESGFTFNTHKPRVRVEWNKIRIIDIESIIRDRRFVLIEQHLNDILECVLESEFDVRILDEGVLKMFHLAQLAIEYQQFCRQYLDRSVYVLREEITTLAQELDYAKKAIREKEEEIRKNKRKVKYNYRGQLPYGNDNIANMILQTLANKSDLFSTTAQNEHGHFNKCNYCDKVFMNQLYLKSHLARRHSNISEFPNKDPPPVEKKESNDIQNDNHLKLQNEIMELKSKLKDMEVFLKFVNTQEKPSLNLEVVKNNVNDIAFNEIKVNRHVNDTTMAPEKQTKDAQVSTYHENFILDKIEEWKKEECEKYNKEICLLRTQITNIIESYKNTQQTKSESNDNKMMEQLHETIKQQSSEILSLKEELKKSRLKSNEEMNIKKEVEAQMAFWTDRVEIQTKEYNLLLEKLDNVAKEAQESRECARLEKERAMKLQNLLDKINVANNVSNHKPVSTSEKFGHTERGGEFFKNDENISPKKCNPTPDRKTLEKLQRRAQELLNQSITSSETSSTSDKIDLPVEKTNYQNGKINRKKKIETGVKNLNSSKSVGNGILHNNQHPLKVTKALDPHKNKPKLKKIIHGSPLKIIRAKITEEVNQRLVSLGVDPLKKRLPRDTFQKHRTLLQEKNEIKSKKNAGREKVYHSIISYLDDKATIKKEQTTQEDYYISPSRNTKPFSLTSVISNVKSIALSLVKTNEDFKKADKTHYDNVTKKALSLLKTPPESTTSSPVTRGKPNKELTQTSIHFGNENKNRKETKNSYGKTGKRLETSDDSDTDISERFHLSNRKIVLDEYVNNRNRRPFTVNSTNELRMENKKKENLDSSEKPRNITNTFETTNTYTQELNQKLEDNDDNASIQEHELRCAVSDENVNNQKQTKGVLKSASSMSSLYKKKVIFDMDAIQMKSVSASPSQSATDKSDKDEKYDLGIINLDTEEWDVSSIEHEPIRNEGENKINTRTSPKIAELKQVIESQLQQRNQHLSTALVGGVDVLKGPMLTKTSSLGGSNTSLGSSILDESDCALQNNHVAIVKPKNIRENDVSEIDISELIIGDNRK